MLLQLGFLIAFVSLLAGQNPGTDATRPDIAQWAGKTGLPVATVHHLWRSASHFDDENDDDSRIVLLDSQSLAFRNQLLMVTSAGIPPCLTVTVFSKAVGNAQVLSESQTPDGRGFCEHRASDLRYTL